MDAKAIEKRTSQYTYESYSIAILNLFETATMGSGLLQFYKCLGMTQFIFLAS
jgi:hypothetical protein